VYLVVVCRTVNKWTQEDPPAAKAGWDRRAYLSRPGNYQLASL